MMPNFFMSEYFVPEVDNWHLKAGAPDDVRKEFEEYMASDGDVVFSDEDPLEALADTIGKTEETFSILKSSDDKRLVFGWASIAVAADGGQIEDIQKDVIEPEDLEEAAYEYVLHFRDTGEEHQPGYRKKGKLVESCVFTKDKQAAMGLPAGILPEGWWIGFYIEDDDAWERIKNGTYRMFSIEGRAERVPMNDVEKSADYAEPEYELIEEVEKFNPYHDERGRFTHAGGASSVTFKPGASRAHDNALEREHIKENYYYGKTRKEVERALDDLRRGHVEYVDNIPAKNAPWFEQDVFRARYLAQYGRLSDANEMLAYMDKYGVNNAATDRPKLNPNFKEPAKEPAKPRNDKPKSKWELERELKREQEDTKLRQQIAGMMDGYKPKAKPKLKHEQMGLFGDMGKSAGDYEVIVEVQKENKWRDPKTGRFTNKPRWQSDR